jgi:hypothetical protein
VFTADVPIEKTPWHVSAGNNTSAEVKDGKLHVIDRGTQRTELRAYSVNWSADPAMLGVLEARVKCVSCSGTSGVYMMTSNGEVEDSITIYPDRVELQHAQLSYPMDTTDDFHTYRLELEGKDMRVYVDGVLRLDATGKCTHPAYEGRNHVGFGSCSSAATSEAYWESVKYCVLTPKEPQPVGMKHTVIFKQEGVYACFPSLTVLDDGRLVTSFGTRVTRSHIDPRGGSKRMGSVDGGETWQDFADTFVNPRYRTGKDGFLVNANARGWVHRPAEEKAALEKVWPVVRAVREGTIAYLGGAQVSKSRDGGKTWQTEEIPTPPGTGLMSFHGGIRTSRGVHLVPIYGKTMQSKHYQPFVLRSADDGETWQFLPLSHAPEDKFGLSETTLLEVGNGDILAMMRSEEAGGWLYQTRSTDQGRTWTEAEKTGLWGHPANLLRLKNGHILCTYGYRRRPMGVRAAFSHDGRISSRLQR